LRKTPRHREHDYKREHQQPLHVDRMSSGFQEVCPALKKLRCRMRQERSHKPKKSEAIAGKVSGLVTNSFRAGVADG
jgi:hypothetical protein